MPATILRSRRQKSVDQDRLARAHRSFIRLHRQEERRTVSALLPIWSPLITTILARMERAGGHPPVEALFNPAEFRQPFNRAMSRRWLATIESGVSWERNWIETAAPDSKEQRASSLWSVRQDVEMDPEELARSMIEIEMPPAMRAAVADWLKDRQVGVWKKVADSTTRILRDTIAAGLTDGDTATELQERVRAVLTDYSKVAARRVARTESTGSMNFGEQIARDEARIEWKEWVATIDRRTRGADPKKKSRFNHYAAHGQKVGNKSVFVVSGQKLKHPGDTSQGASAGNIVNCRCAGIAAFDPPKAEPVSYPAVPAAATSATEGGE